MYSKTMELQRTAADRTPTKTGPPVAKADPARAGDAYPGHETDYDIDEGFRCAFKIPPEDFDAMQRYLDSPPERNPGLEKLFRQARKLRQPSGFSHT